MLILLDEQLPRGLTRQLSPHQVRTVQQCGWAGLRNGELLRAATAGVDVFVTADRNLTYQQNLSGSPLRVVVLGARTNKIADLLPLIPALLLAIDDARPGEIRWVGLP
jgi:predicted nuclease of predicted toxin-antitoxin system